MVKILSMLNMLVLVIMLLMVKMLGVAMMSSLLVKKFLMAMM